MPNHNGHRFHYLKTKNPNQRIVELWIPQNARWEQVGTILRMPGKQGETGVFVGTDTEGNRVEHTERRQVAMKLARRYGVDVPEKVVRRV